MTQKKLLNVLFLVNLDRFVVAVLDFHAEELLRDAEIFHIKLLNQELFDSGNVILVFAGYNEVICWNCEWIILLFYILEKRLRGLYIDLPYICVTEPSRSRRIEK